MKRLLLIGMLVLAGCGNSPSSGEDAIQDVNILALESRIETIERGMEALKKSPTPSVEMKPSDKGWSWLKGDGITIRIGMEKLDDHGNGSRLGLVIQNPLAVKLKDCSLAVAWSSTDKSGNVIDSTRHAKEFDLDGAFPAGDYAFPSIDLADLKPSEIGLLTFSGFSCKRTATATP